MARQVPPDLNIPALLLWTQKCNKEHSSLQRRFEGAIANVDGIQHSNEQLAASCKDLECRLKTVEDASKEANEETQPDYEAAIRELENLVANAEHSTKVMKDTLYQQLKRVDTVLRDQQNWLVEALKESLAGVHETVSAHIDEHMGKADACMEKKLQWMQKQLDQALAMAMAATKHAEERQRASEPARQTVQATASKISVRRRPSEDETPSPASPCDRRVIRHCVERHEMKILGEGIKNTRREAEPDYTPASPCRPARRILGAVPKGLARGNQLHMKQSRGYNYNSRMAAQQGQTRAGQKRKREDEQPQIKYFPRHTLC